MQIFRDYSSPNCEKRKNNQPPNKVILHYTGMKDELEQIIRQRVESFLENMNLVTREEFEVTNAMIVKSREEQERLLLRIAELEMQIATLFPKKSPKGSANKQTKTKKNPKKSVSTFK